MESIDDILTAIGCLVAAKSLKSLKSAKKCMGEGIVVKKSKYIHVNLLTKLKICSKDWQNYIRMAMPPHMQLLTVQSDLCSFSLLNLRKFSAYAGGHRT